MTTIDNETILIGPTGFLGPSFLRYYPNLIGVGRGNLPPFLDNKFIKIEKDLDFSILDNVDFSNVIFLIGNSDHHVLNNSSVLAMEKNVIPWKIFLDYLVKSKKKVNKIINFTTMLQYDSLKMKLPCDENQPRNPFINNYVMSKYISELISEQYRDRFSIIDIRMSNVYGPTHLRRPDIVPSIIWKIFDNKELSVWNKKPIRDFIFVKDACDAVIKLLSSDYSGPVNLGSGKGTSISDLCNIIEQLSGKTIKEDNSIVTGHMEFYQDINLLKSLIDWTPKFNLDIGLKITYDEMIGNLCEKKFTFN